MTKFTFPVPGRADSVGRATVAGEEPAVRRPLAVALLTASLCALPAAPASARAFTATFDDRVQRQDSPTCGAVFCLSRGTTSLGPATLAVDVTSFELTGRSTADVGTVAVITLLADGSTLTLEQTGVVRFPGNSTNAPGAGRSWGNPFSYAYGWEVTGGTGRFAGAGGAGTGTLSGSGAVLRAALSGTI